MNEAKSNGAKAADALIGLLGKLDLPTLIVVMLMGGGNLLTTKQDGALTREEAERVTREVHDLHRQLSEWEGRQKTALEKIDQILRALQNKNP